MSNPCSPIIDAGTALLRAAHHAVHKHTGIGIHLHTAALHAPVAYGPPAPHVAALCSKTPGTALAAGPGAAPPGAIPAGTVTDAASAAPPVGGGGVPGGGVPGTGGYGPTGLAGPVGTSAAPVFGAAKAAMLATALAVGMGTAAVAYTSMTPDQSTPVADAPSPPDSIPASSPPLILFVGGIPPDEQIPPDRPAYPGPPDSARLDTPTPVPEPASVLTLALGGALATLCHRRRRRA